MQENLDLFLTDFGVVGTLTARLRSPSVAEVRVLFDEEYTPIEFGAEGHSITATTRTDFVQNVHHGDTLAINGKTYKIIGIHPIMDGRFTELVLKDS